MAQIVNKFIAKSAAHMGSIKWVANGNAYWSYQGGSFGNFTAHNTIPTPVVTNLALDAGNNLPEIKFASLKPGNYQFVVTGAIYEVGGNQNWHAFRFTDGTNTSTPIVVTVTTSGGLSSSPLIGSISYSSPQTNITFTIEGYCPASDTIYLEAEIFDFQIDVYYFPEAT